MIVFRIFAIFLVLGGLSGHRSKRNIGNGLQLASGLLEFGVDPSAEPCSGFFNYACGSALHNVNFISATDKWESDNLDMLHYAIVQLNSSASKINIPLYGKKVIQLYETCMTDDSFLRLEEVKAAVLLHLETEGDGLKIPDQCPPSSKACNKGMYKLLARLHKTFGRYGLFNLGIEDTGTGLVIQISKPVNAFMGCLFNRSCNEDIIDIPPNFDTVTLPELMEGIGFVNWPELFANLLSKEQFSRLNQSSMIELERSDYTYLKAFLNDSRRAADFFIDHVSHNYFYKQNHSRGLCLCQIRRKMSSAALRLIFDHYEWNIEEWIHSLDQLFETIKSAFIGFISHAEWITGSEKAKVQQKAKSMRFYTGIPDWLANETEVDRRTVFSLDAYTNSSYVLNLLAIDKDIYNHKLSMVDFNPTFYNLEPDFEIDAFYMNSVNYARLHGGLSIPPAYHIDYPSSVKYGMLGRVIGHELMHAFNPAYATDMLNESTKDFLLRQRCLQKRLFSYCHKERGRCLNGPKHLKEVMSDIDGLKIAYMAMKIATETTADAIPVPGFANLTDDQTFFVAFSQRFCTNSQSLSFDIDGLEYDVHPPSKARVDISVSSFPMFAKAFQCRVDSYHVPTKTCSLWGDYHSNAKLGQFK